MSTTLSFRVKVSGNTDEPAGLRGKWWVEIGFVRQGTDFQTLNLDEDKKSKSVFYYLNNGFLFRNGHQNGVLGSKYFTEKGGSSPLSDNPTILTIVNVTDGTIVWKEEGVKDKPSKELFKCQYEDLKQGKWHFCISHGYTSKVDLLRSE